MKREDQIREDKKVYIKPQITEVRLVAGEAVLANCKDAIGGLSNCQSHGDTKCTGNAPRS